MRSLILLLSLAAPLAAQHPQIHGVVLDPTGLPIIGAAVECAGATTFTNAEGRFTAEAPTSAPECPATVAKRGFRTETHRLQAGEENRLVLQLQGPTDSVVVTATRYQTTPEGAAVSASVVTAADLDARSLPQIPDVLRELPGLQVSEYGRRGALTELFTRGADSTGTLVLLDGVPLNDPGGELNLAHISSVGIERMEVVRGPESALFGAEAAAGVVQLFTKRGDPEQTAPHFTGSYERGNFQTDRWTGAMDGGLFNRFDYYLAADQLHTVGAYQNDFYRDTSGTANVGYRFSEATQLRGIFRIYDANIGTPGQISYGIDDLGTTEQTRDSTVSLRLDDARGSHYLQQFTFGYHRLNDFFNDTDPFSTQDQAALVRDVTVNGLARTYFVQLLNPNALPVTVPSGLRIAENTTYFSPYTSLNLTERKIAGYQGTWMHRGGSIVFGYNYQRQESALSSGGVERDNHGLYFNAQQSIGSRILLTGGARFEHSSAFGAIGSGRGGASILLFGETTLRLSAGRGTTEPSLLENFVQSPYYFGNPNLKPETTTTYEAALVQEWWQRRLRAEVSVFRSSFHNLIAFVSDTWQNVEASWARGAEFSSQARILPNVLVTGTYMRLYTRITASTTPLDSTTGLGNELVRRPRNSGALTIAVTPKRWSLVVGTRFVGERQDADFTFGVNRNPGYENVFASISYQINRHIIPTLRVDNLLNERYEEVLGYPALPRSVSGGFRFAF
jgi:vitamin B12 transporter